jgi:N-methylhydantoinase A
MHACAIADELRMERILCPPASGVLAALGLVVSDRRRDAQRSLLLSGEGLSADAVGAAHAELAARAREALGDSGAPLRATYELRYRGQAFELPVEREGDEAADPGELRAAFAAAHEERYGYADPEGEVELVTLRVAAAVPGPDVALTRDGAGAAEPEGSRGAVFAGQERETAVWRGALPPGTAVEGPAVCELAESTLVVAPGWAGEVDDTGAVKLERAG